MVSFSKSILIMPQAKDKFKIFIFGSKKIDSKDFSNFPRINWNLIYTVIAYPFHAYIHSKYSESIGHVCTCGQLCCIINTPLISVSSSRSRSLCYCLVIIEFHLFRTQLGSRSFTNRSCLRVARSSNFNQPPNVVHVLGHHALHSLALSVYIYIYLNWQYFYKFLSGSLYIIIVF